MTVTSMPYYQWTNPDSREQFVIQNVDSVTYNIDGKPVTANAYRQYRGLMFVLERAQKNRWQAQFSWVISQTKGTVSNSRMRGSRADSSRRRMGSCQCGRGNRL